MTIPHSRPVRPPRGQGTGNGSDRAVGPGGGAPAGRPVDRSAPGADVARPQQGSSPASPAARGIGIAVAASLLVFLTVVLVLFAVFNTQSVRVSLVFGDVDAPLWLALAAAAALGGLVVGMGGLALRARRKHR